MFHSRSDARMHGSGRRGGAGAMAYTCHIVSLVSLTMPFAVTVGARAEARQMDAGRNSCSRGCWGTPHGETAQRCAS